MTNENMTVDRVLELIAAFGAEPGGWPEEDRAAAEAVLTAQPGKFAKAIEDAKELDARLVKLAVPEPPADLANRILATAPKDKAASKAGGLGWFLPAQWRWPTGAILSSLAVGVVSGYAYAGSFATDTELSLDDAYNSAFGYSAVNSWMDTEIEQ